MHNTDQLFGFYEVGKEDPLFLFFKENDEIPSPFQSALFDDEENRYHIKQADVDCSGEQVGAFVVETFSYEQGETHIPSPFVYLPFYKAVGPLIGNMERHSINCMQDRMELRCSLFLRSGITPEHSEYHTLDEIVLIKLMKKSLPKHLFLAIAGQDMSFLVIKA